MKPTNITLSEAQLADLFKNESIKHTSKSDADDCLGTTAASSNRLKHVEDIANDHTAAQAFKATFAFKEWAEVVAESVENSRRSWFNFLGMGSPLKTAFATATFAFAFAFALPVITQFSSQEPTHMALPADQSMAQDDIINSIQFDGPSDRLSHSGFDGHSQNQTDDGLFNGSFG